MVSADLWSQIENQFREIGQTLGIQPPTTSPFKWSAPAGVDSPNLAQMIDHTLLKPESTESDVRKVCQEAKTFGFKAVCVSSSWIDFVSQELKEARSLPICVVGFPNGVNEIDSQIFETKRAIHFGAQEIDMVIHRGWLRQKDWKRLYQGIKAIKGACGSIPLKVILESHLLDTAEKIAGTILTRFAGAEFAKTCTGFTGGGATEQDVRLMRAIMGPDGGVKASGGVKTKADALQMLSAGANRIGTSSGVTIVSGDKSAGPDSY